MSRKFGNFKVKEKIAQGAMGEIFLVEDEEGNEFALKTLLPNLVVSDNSESKARFLREISLCENIKHPRIVSINCFDLESGVVNPKDFVQNERYMQGLTKEIKRTIERVRLMDLKIENQKRELNKRRLETRKLEIHEDREKEAWKEEFSRKEQADFDDLASIRQRFLKK